jgi:hypothetical protein
MKELQGTYSDRLTKLWLLHYWSVWSVLHPPSLRSATTILSATYLEFQQENKSLLLHLLKCKSFSWQYCCYSSCPPHQPVPTGPTGIHRVNHKHTLSAFQTTKIWDSILHKSIAIISYTDHYEIHFYWKYQYEIQFHINVLKWSVSMCNDSKLPSGHNAQHSSRGSASRGKPVNWIFQFLNYFLWPINCLKYIFLCHKCSHFRTARFSSNMHLLQHLNLHVKCNVCAARQMESTNTAIKGKSRQTFLSNILLMLN